ncbi:RING finger protein 212B [Drosophila serrata]|uniref:RING finger protein 212B n=1 Tax=Drosophila serrata TaxID=7274 RepID=UPI000A1D32EB|nr:RING finger protein 212B [Drosophila serrata]
MFRLHCNKCFRNRNLEPALTFHFSRCHHILCARCLDDASNGQQCPLCSLTLQTIPISGNMPSGMAQYFEDPNKFLQLYRKISKFQCDQRASDNLGFWRQTQDEQAMELQLEGFGKMEAQLNQQINLEKMRIAEMRDYISYHEQIARRRSMDDFKELKTAHKRRRPRTPCFNSSDNTLSDESLGVSFCLDAGMDFPKEQLNLVKTPTMTTSEDSDFTV